jgi:hypothetical protein
MHKLFSWFQTMLSPLRSMVLSACTAVVLLLGLAGPAHAQNICLRVTGVPQGDVLNLRAAPQAAADIVQPINPSSPGVLILKRPCGPSSATRNQQWCRVRHIRGVRLRDGFVSARYVQEVRCP